MVIYIAVTIGLIILCFALWSKFRGGWKRVHQRLLGGLTLIYGIILASLTGSYTALVLPGFGGIALGTGVGAAVGFGAWLALGTIGVATGGIGLAIGAAGMTAIGALFGGIGGAAGGFGFRQVSYSLIHPIFWVPLLILGAYFLWGHKLKKLRGRDNSEH